jgi:hypothetical protein
MIFPAQSVGASQDSPPSAIDACYALPMEYKGIEYAVRARPGPHQWVWTILPKGEAALMSQFVGTKEGASAAACRGIDRWLERQRARGRAFARKVARRAAGCRPICDVKP